jgi:hypothetical protein
MKNIKITVILIFGLFCFCCKHNTYYNEIVSVVNSHLSDDLKRYEKIVIIPGSGCSGCITQAEDFFLKNVKNEKIKFILTYNFSKKNLTLKLKKENVDRPNVLIDNDNVFYLQKYEERIYPVTLKIVKGKITEVMVGN